MLPTPDYSHLRNDAFGSVYEPAEDSFLLLDALEADKELLRNRLSSKLNICVEIGSGSGVVTAFLKQSILGDIPSFHICTDINLAALKATQLTANKAHRSFYVQTIHTSLLQGIRLGLGVDLLIFNPPYHPTGNEEIDQDISSAAWAGGALGLDVIRPVIENIETILSGDGMFYFVAVSRNDPAEVLTRLNEKSSIKAEIALARRAGRESLHIIRAQKSKDD